MMHIKKWEINTLILRTRIKDKKNRKIDTKLKSKSIDTIKKQDRKLDKKLKSKAIDTIKSKDLQ